VSQTNPYRAAIEATFPDLDGWKARAARDRVERPERGSQLAVDDQVFPHWPISEVARMSLVAAAEHLRLARDAIRAGQLYPSAHFTALRSARVGACQGVWMLRPDDTGTRRERGLTVIAETYHQSSVYYNELAKHDLTTAERADLVDQQTWLQGRQTQVATLRTGSARLDLTNIVIPNALDHTFSDKPRREEGRRMWRELSADAHVLVWSIAQRSIFGQAARRTGVAEATAGGDWAELAPAFVASHLLLKEGWSLFDRRCEGAST